MKLNPTFITLLVCITALIIAAMLTKTNLSLKATPPTIPAIELTLSTQTAVTPQK